MTDWVNGANLIMDPDGHIIWGTIMCIMPFAPMAIIGPVIGIEWNKKEHTGCCGKMVMLMLYLPGVAIATPIYMVLWVYLNIKKFSDLDSHLVYFVSMICMKTKMQQNQFFWHFPHWSVILGHNF